MAEAEKPKTVRVVGHNTFHLRGRKNLFPTVNLTSGKDVPSDEVHRKTAWSKDYLVMSAKLAAELSTAEREANPDLMAYWKNQAAEAMAKSQLSESMPGATPEQLDAAWKTQGPALLQSALKSDPTDLNMQSSAMRQMPDPAALGQAHERNFLDLQKRWEQLSPEQQNGMTPPRLRAPGQTLDGSNPDIVTNAADRAFADKAKFLGAQTEGAGDSGAGFAGALSPVAGAVPGLWGAAAQLGTQLGGAFAPNVLGDGDRAARVDATGKPQGNIGSDTPLLAKAQESNDVANKIHDYNAATTNGDTVGAANIADKIRENQGANPAALANTAVSADNARGAWHGVGSQLFNASAVPAGLPATPGFNMGLLRGLPMLGAVGAGLPLGVAAWHAPAGQKLDAMREALPGAAEGVARMGATGTGIAAALPGLSGAGGSGFLGRLGALGRGLTSAVPGVVTGAGARALAGKAGVAGAIAGGVNGISDLAKHYLSDDAAAADNAEVRNQALANSDQSKGGQLASAAGAGAQILGGNIEPARRQFGAAWGRILPNTPAGRNVTEGLREGGAVAAGSDARSQTLQALNRDSRFAGMDPNVAENLGALGAEQGSTAATLNYGKGPNEQATPDHFQQYSQARLAQASGKATPEQLSYLSELAGEPIQAGTPMNGAQQQAAGRNVALYHHLGAGNARQLLQGHVPYKTQEGQPSQAAGAVAPAVGVPKPPAPAPVAAKPAPAPTPVATAPKPLGVPKVAAEFVGQPVSDVPTPAAAPKLTSPTPAAPIAPKAPATPMNAAAAPAPTAPLPAMSPAAPAAPPVPTAVVTPPAQPAQALTPAQPKVDYKTLASDVVTKVGPERDEALRRYTDWAGNASPEERAAGRDALIRSGISSAVPVGGNVLADFTMRGMTEAQKNKMIVDRFRQAGTDVGNGISAAAAKEWGGKGGGLGAYLMSNPSMMMLPIGIALAIGGGNKTKMLGLMAAAGGAYNLFSRYKAVSDPNFLKAVQTRVAAQQHNSWTPEQEAQFSAQHGDAWKDLQAAQAGGLVNIPQQAGQQAVDMIGKVLPGYNAPTAGAQPIPAQAPVATVKP